MILDMDDYDRVGDIPINELRHYGVKGMKWGVRKNRDGGGSGGDTKRKRKPPPSDREIRNARRKMSGAMEDEWANAGLRKKASIAFLGEASGQLSRDYRMMPERAVALRSTSGERLAATILAGPTGGLSVAVLASNTVARKSIEREQAAAAGR